MQLITYEQFRHCYIAVIVACHYDQLQASIVAKTLLHKAMLVALVASDANSDAGSIDASGGESRLVWGSRVLAATLCDLYARYGSFAGSAWAELSDASLLLEAATARNTLQPPEQQGGQQGWERARDEWDSLISSKAFVKEIKDLITPPSGAEETK